MKREQLLDTVPRVVRAVHMYRLRFNLTVSDVNYPSCDEVLSW